MEEVTLHLIILKEKLNSATKPKHVDSFKLIIDQNVKSSFFLSLWDQQTPTCHLSPAETLLHFQLLRSFNKYLSCCAETREGVSCHQKTPKKQLERKRFRVYDKRFKKNRKKDIINDHLSFVFPASYFIFFN